MIKKLKQKRGETLIETLFSMLIAVLSMGILCTAVMAASNLNMQTREMDKKYSEELRAVEGLDESVAREGVLIKISFQPEDGSPAYFTEKTITTYGDEESAFLSYDYKGDRP